MRKTHREEPAGRSFHLGETGIICYDSQRILATEEQAERFTKTEYTIVQCLLRGNMVSLHRLCALLGVSAEDPSTRKVITKHVEKVRSKLRSFGLSVRCVHQYGYIVIPTDQSA